MTGIAGIGKSRLGWEFYKYFDGIVEQIWWHRGRCLAYGEGVAYWALADMVRMRCRIAEDEPVEAALSKLRETLREQLLDDDERRFVEPRLAQLLGLADGESSDRQDLFAAWRLFFERLADSNPVVLALRGPAVGGRLAARLHRVPARMVAQPPGLRDHPLAARTARAAARLGRRPAELHVDLPRAALRERDDGAARRARPRPAGRAARPDPRARRRRPPLRGRDGADAARPRRARADGRPSTARPASSRRSRCPRRCRR